MNLAGDSLTATNEVLETPARCKQKAKSDQAEKYTTCIAIHDCRQFSSIARWGKSVVHA
jgi:hypothetical protein